MRTVSTETQIYLSSNSPRRAELLTQIGVTFERVKAEVEEVLQPDEAAEQYVTRLARQKAQAGFLNSAKDKPVLGADTIVVIDEQILEKPRDKTHAEQMMNLLSGRTHQVFTAVALVNERFTKACLVKTDVTFKPLTLQQISDYWQTGEPIDKAAGYGIQGIGGRFVTHINGSYTAVVGLPLYETDMLIKEFLEESRYVG
ncbi:septum formation inhibitor Maf [Psychromonas sp. psych-6C06]|uniref:Maf family protein n=1 Tax=Psychromonas sp. psych-6C06 TaxID=2058089 RepID=UPI000C34B022|nr:Maf family protein [Psychromonas sp. psych-6C06]PKF62260.1 septum formation inhibitor Maf [Psychromonas sp. psych-6C06]